jgi:hypothetical protein
MFTANLRIISPASQVQESQATADKKSAIAAVRLLLRIKALLMKLRFMLAATLALVWPNTTQTQNSSVKLSGQVGGAIALSVAAVISDDQIQMSARNLDHQTILLTIQGARRHPAEISIPVQLRSNTGSVLTAEVKAHRAKLRSLLVTGIRATGDKVMADALEKIIVDEAFDGRRHTQPDQAALSFPAEILSAPRISRRGNLISPANAVEIMLSLKLKPSGGDTPWTIRIVLSAR